MIICSHLAASEITNLSLVFASDQDVFGLEVSMDDEFLVSICDSTGNTLTKFHFIIVCKFLSIALHVIVESTLGTVLHHHVKIIVVYKIAVIKLDNVRMCQVFQVIDLPNDLITHSLRIFVEFFYC
jgi:hypothetical protein